MHSKQQALKALEIAKSTFDRVSFDLIYARQFQSLTEWKSELIEALSFAGDHLSLYQLTIEDGTAFAARAARGKLAGLPSEDLSADMYDLTQDLCGAAGLPAYEVSNHATPGSESRHNMIYWRGGDYIGVGPGAHGRVTRDDGRFATEAFRDPKAWLSAVSSEKGGDRPWEKLSREDVALEYLLMSLRTNEGLNLERYAKMAERQIPEHRLVPLIDLGLISRDEGWLKTTRSGRLVLNGILKDLAAD
jgi:oxygen-independent coproporphyrinogen-3 oxidase